MALGDWKGFKKRRAEARKRKKLRGIGLCSYLETTGGSPRERAEITVQPEGQVDVVVGTLSSGQGHETSFAQCVAEWLGVPFDDVNLFECDTDIVKEGGGSHSARSMRIAGIVMGKASDAIVEKGKKIAAHMLETAEDDIAFAERPLHRQRHRPLDRHFRRRQGGGGEPQSLAGRLARAARRHRGRNHQAARLSLRRACLRGRDRSADRRARPRALHRGRRRRPRHQSDGAATGKPTAASRRASARRCGNCAPTTRTGNC